MAKPMPPPEKSSAGRAASEAAPAVVSVALRADKVPMTTRGSPRLRQIYKELRADWTRRWKNYSAWRSARF